MSLLEWQRSGMLIVLILSIAVYGLSYLNIKQPANGKAIPWGIQKAESTIVELKGIKPAGIYFLPSEATYQELRRLADTKEFAGSADFDSVKMSNGTLFIFSGEGKWTRGRISSATRLALSLPVDINRASAKDLSFIPGIGEGLAAKIILLREEKKGFLRLEELKEVPGIKGKKLNKLKSYIYAGPIR
jgi:competence ComEA-like helix-hairpin-helix protein